MLEHLRGVRPVPGGGCAWRARPQAAEVAACAARGCAAQGMVEKLGTRSGSGSSGRSDGSDCDLRSRARSGDGLRRWRSLSSCEAAEKMPMLPQAAPQPQAAAVPPAAPRSAPQKSHKPELTSATRRAPIAEPEETAAEPPSEVINGLLSRREEPAETPGFERHRSADESFVRAGAAPEGTPPTEAAAYDEERKKKAEEESEDRRQLAAKAPMPSDGHSSESATAVGGAPANNQPVDVSAQQLETQPAPAAGNLQLHGLRSMVNVATGPYAFHLPSGRLAVSIASADHRTLAVDEKGTLFLREDSGGTWEKVKRQWTGRAVLVRSAR